MDEARKILLKNKVTERFELFQLNHTRFGRLLKDPFRTLIFFILTGLSRLKPFKITTETLWGDKISFYLPEGNQIYYYGFWEANLTNFFINFLKEGDTIIDIGAHVGLYSLLSSALVGNSGKVYSFEPTPRTFESLKENASTKKNIITENFAVFDKETSIDFIDYGPQNSAFNTYKARDINTLSFLNSFAKNITVKTIVLDNYCANKNIKPDFIKIDAEGAEHIILKGASHILNQVRPIISIEVSGDEEWAENCRESIDILIQNKYEPFQISLDGCLFPHQRLTQYSYDNLIFVPQEKIKSLGAIIRQRAPAEESRNIKLHLGCGETYLKGYVNVDFPPDSKTIMKVKADIYQDMRTLGYGKESVDEIRSHHVFEHFNRADAIRLLLQWRRWLKKGGKLVIETPDFFWCSFLVLAAPFKYRMELGRHLFGSQEDFWANHLDFWDAGKFKKTLHLCGFEDIKISHPLYRNLLPNIMVTASKNCEMINEEGVLKKILKWYVLNGENEEKFINNWLKK